MTSPVENTVKIKTADGQYGTVPAKDLQQALASDAEVVTDQEYNRAALEKEYGGLGGSAAALGLGAARGATLGLSDVAATAIGGEEARKAIVGYQEANPIASGGGEVAGMLAPLVLSGGAAAPVEEASLAARGIRGAGSAVRAVDALGAGAERLAARVVGTGAESIVGRGAQRAVALGARSAAEGAAYGAFQQLDEDALGDKEVTAEKLWAAAEKGALFTGLLGGGLGFASGAAERGIEKARTSIARRLGTSFGEAAEKESAEFAFRAGGGGKRVASKAEKYAGGTEKVGRIWREEAPELAGKNSFAKMTREDLGIAAERGMAREGDSIRGVLQRVDETAAKEGKLPTFGDLMADVERVKDSVLKHAGQEPLAQRLDLFADSMKRITGAVDAEGNAVLSQPVTFEQWQALRRDADKMWGEAAKGGKTVFLDLRGEMEKSMMARIEGVGSSAELDAYKTAKEKWQAFKLLQDATKNADAAAGSNRFWGLTDTISGAAGGTIGGMVGGLPGAVAGTVLSGAINRTVRTRGDFWMSAALAHMSNIEAAGATTKLLDDRIEAAVQGFLGRTKSAGFTFGSKEVAKPREKKHDEIQVAKAVHHLASNPALLMQKLEEHAGGMNRDMHGVAARYSEVVTRAIGYLASQAPKQKAPTSALQPQMGNPYRMSALERAKWNGAVRGTLQTADVIDDLGKGKVNRYEIQAIAATQPKVFAQLQDVISSQSAALERKLPIQKQAAISRTFDVPVGSMFRPEAVVAYQSTYAPAEAAQENAPSGPSDAEPTARASKLKGPTEQIATSEG